MKYRIVSLKDNQVIDKFDYLEDLVDYFQDHNLNLQTHKVEEFGWSDASADVLDAIDELELV